MMPRFRSRPRVHMCNLISVILLIIISNGNVIDKNGLFPRDHGNWAERRLATTLLPVLQGTKTIALPKRWSLYSDRPLAIPAKNSPPKPFAAEPAKRHYLRVHLRSALCTGHGTLLRNIRFGSRRVRLALSTQQTTGEPGRI